MPPGKLREIYLFFLSRPRLNLDLSPARTHTVSRFILLFFGLEALCSRESPICLSSSLFSAPLSFRRRRSSLCELQEILSCSLFFLFFTVLLHWLHVFLFYFLFFCLSHTYALSLLFLKQGRLLILGARVGPGVCDAIILQFVRKFSFNSGGSPFAILIWRKPNLVPSVTEDSYLKLVFRRL